MNDGAFNSYTLNGAPVDSVVRAIVRGLASAQIAATGRVFSYLRVQSASRAQITGPKGRVVARLRAVSVAHAKAILRPAVWARLVVAATGTAQIVVGVGSIRAKVSAAARAQVQAFGRVVQRGIAASFAAAQITSVALIRRRSPAALTARAVVDADGKVLPRVYWRDPLALRAVARLSTASKVIARASVPVLLRAQIQAGGSIQVRAAVQAPARAAVLVQIGVIRRGPWDEPAPSDRVFVVPEGVFIFEVTS